MTFAEEAQVWQEQRWYRLAGKLLRLALFPDGTFYRKRGSPIRRGRPEPITVCYWCQTYLHEGHGPEALCHPCEVKARESARFFGD